MAKNTVLSKEEILHLAKLANLSLSDEEIEKYSKQLTETIAYAENLSELDTSKVKPTSSSAHLENIYFEDGTKNTRGLSAEEAVANAKEKKDKYFKVGRIM
jgi:aspartyl-tRNA(Asn)/glutamyl-tRNA(Gln) amidotransferase subunit C